MKQAPEPIILAVALALLGIGAACLGYFYPSVADITGIGDTVAKGAKAPALKDADVQARVASWAAPAQWQAPSSGTRLFQSAPYLFYASAYPNGDYIKKLGPDTRSPSGVLISWYTSRKLDFTDANVDREDPDGDGFSNLTEYKNEAVGERLKAADLDGSKSTNPNDPKSHPDFLARLRLQKYEKQPFRIQFKGYLQLNGVYLFELTLQDVDSAHQPPPKKSGDQLGVEGYKIGGFHQQFQDIMNKNTRQVEHKDVSTLDLVREDIGLTVTVPFRQTIDSPDSTADFVMLMPTETDKVIRISAGKTFSPPYLTGNSYLVISAGDAGAKIRDTKSGQEYSIPNLDPSEWNEIPVPPAPKQP
jgi:hypothetical protein